MLRALAPAILTFLLLPASARAGDILFVSDSLSDLNIPGVLMGDGHTVTEVMGDFAAGDNPTLRGDLSAYDMVVWSATGAGTGSAHGNAMVFTNLTSYVMSGGRVFVTGYDSIASPSDPMLIAFVGAMGSRDSDVSPAPVINMVDNSLTTGLVDIRGVMPLGGDSDKDSLLTLGSDTVAVVGSSAVASWTLRTLGSGEVAYISNGAPSSMTSSSWTTMSMGGVGAYNAALRNFADVVLSGAPIIRFSGETVVDEGTDISVTATVHDREMDMFTFSWDLDDDGMFGEMSDVTMYTIPGDMTDGPSTIRLGVEASDGSETRQQYVAITVNNVVPEITSTAPTEQAFIGAEWRYDLAWNDPAGMRDLPLFTFLSSPMGMTVSRGGAIAWTPTAMMRDTTFPVEVQADDGDGGLATQTFEVMVSNNRPPMDPVPLSPVMRERVSETMPSLVITNGTDPDGDRLSYFFQIDNVSSFESSFLVESPEVVEQPMTTTWDVPTNLSPGLWYWRVKVDDGLAQGDWQNANFLVARAESDAGMPDAGPRPDSGTIIPPPPTDDDEGCGCRVAGGDERSAGWLPLATIALLLLRRRVKRSSFSRQDAV